MVQMSFLLVCCHITNSAKIQGPKTKNVYFLLMSQALLHMVVFTHSYVCSQLVADQTQALKCLRISSLRTHLCSMWYYHPTDQFAFALMAGSETSKRCLELALCHFHPITLAKASRLGQIQGVGKQTPFPEALQKALLQRGHYWDHLSTMYFFSINC